MRCHQQRRGPRLSPAHDSHLSLFGTRRGWCFYPSTRSRREKAGNQSCTLGDQRDVNGPPVSPELEIETRANADYSVGLLRARRALPPAGIKKELSTDHRGAVVTGVDRAHARPRPRTTARAAVRARVVRRIRQVGFLSPAARRACACWMRPGQGMAPRSRVATSSVSATPPWLRHSSTRPPALSARRN